MTAPTKPAAQPPSGATTDERRAWHGNAKGSYAHLADPRGQEASETAEAHFLMLVKFLLDARGITHEQAATAMGIGVGTLRDKLSGRYGTRIGEAAQLAVVLGVPLAALVDRSTPIGELLTLGSGR